MTALSATYRAWPPDGTLGLSPATLAALSSEEFLSESTNQDANFNLHARLVLRRKDSVVGADFRSVSGKEKIIFKFGKVFPHHHNSFTIYRCKSLREIGEF